MDVRRSSVPNPQIHKPPMNYIILHQKKFQHRVIGVIFSEFWKIILLRSLFFIDIIIVILLRPVKREIEAAPVLPDPSSSLCNCKMWWCITHNSWGTHRVVQIMYSFKNAGDLIYFGFWEQPGKSASRLQDMSEARKQRHKEGKHASPKISNYCLHSLQGSSHLTFSGVFW